MMGLERILAYQAPAPESGGLRFWFYTLFLVQIPADVRRRLAIAKAAHGIANQLAALDPDANREILYQAGALLGVLNDKEGTQ